MVKGKEDDTYKKLKKRLDGLTDRESPITKILNIWENEGIEAAMATRDITEDDLSTNGRIIVIF